MREPIKLIHAYKCNLLHFFFFYLHMYSVYSLSWLGIFSIASTTSMHHFPKFNIDCFEITLFEAAEDEDDLPVLLSILLDEEK